MFVSMVSKIENNIVLLCLADSRSLFSQSASYQLCVFKDCVSMTLQCSMMPYKLLFWQNLEKPFWSLHTGW